MTINPYSPPQTDSEERDLEGVDAVRLELMAKGQKMIIGSILLYFAVMGAEFMLPDRMAVAIGYFFLVAVLAILGLSLVGVLRLARGLGIPVPFRILLGVMIFAPLLNIVILAVLSSRATKMLRRAGYRVGFFGAKKPA